MKNSIHLEKRHLTTVKNILQKHLPQNAKVWVFGSRATGKIKKFSDIDLLIDLGETISLKIMAELAYDFEESNLPYKVDIVDSNTINENFRERIEKEKIELIIH